MTALLKYDAACQAIAEAKSFDEVQEWIDKAAAVREYTRRIGNRQLELDAIEIRVRAKRRRGELLLELKDQGRFRDGKPSSEDDGSERLTLAELGITPNESSEDQKMAKIEGNAFERLVARCRAHAEAEKRHSFDVLKPPPSAPSATMHSRMEPDDSLDYFPTPPWATRALFEHVLPAAGVQHAKGGIWEPACGEGHIAEVCAEYTPHVAASDIHDYGYGDVCDFLDKQATQLFAPGWIITNPPFGDKALEFVDTAIAQASIGVAMFFRSQWAVEGIERYERVFKNNPPTMCAFFVERVPLHKGRWDPEGATLTAYCWLVWIKGAAPRAPLWIPPGCRDRLSKPDDVDRFTASPVKKRITITPHNPETGEVLETESTECASDGSPAKGDAQAASAADPESQALAVSSSEIPEMPAFLRREPIEEARS